MAWTVWSAFDDFRKNVVDINPQVTKKARSSRDYLFNQIKIQANINSEFPKLLSSDSFMTFGSFARKTKIQPLNDIDFLVILDGSNTIVENNYQPYSYKLKFVKPAIYFMSSVPSLTLEQFADQNGYINSTRILNKIKIYLSNLNIYAKADIKKTMQAVTLDLKSYDWVYDIVPALKVNRSYTTKDFFLIPDGNANWIATDPRIDSYNITQVNLKHDRKFLPTMRLLKYWNSRTYKPVLKSYYFETLVIKVFNNYQYKITDFPHAIKAFFDYCYDYFIIPCPDPKNLGPNLDANIDNSIKQKVLNAMKDASHYAGDALIYESQSNPKLAISYWKKVFGSNFPDYG